MTMTVVTGYEIPKALETLLTEPTHERTFLNALEILEAYKKGAEESDPGELSEEGKLLFDHICENLKEIHIPQIPNPQKRLALIKKLVDLPESPLTFYTFMGLLNQYYEEGPDGTQILSEESTEAYDYVSKCYDPLGGLYIECLETRNNVLHAFLDLPYSPLTFFMAMSILESYGLDEGIAEEEEQAFELICTKVLPQLQEKNQKIRISPYYLPPMCDVVAAQESPLKDYLVFDGFHMINEDRLNIEITKILRGFSSTDSSDEENPLEITVVLEGDLEYLLRQDLSSTLWRCGFYANEIELAETLESFCCYSETKKQWTFTQIDGGKINFIKELKGFLLANFFLEAEHVHTAYLSASQMDYLNRTRVGHLGNSFSDCTVDQFQKGKDAELQVFSTPVKIESVIPPLF